MLEVGRPALCSISPVSLVQEMRARGPLPDVTAVNATIGACSRAGNPSLSLLEPQSCRAVDSELSDLDPHQV